MTNYNEASEQAWPSFVDILSSTVLVLCFALLVLVIVLSVTKVTSSTRKESDESSPSTFRVEADVLGPYRAEFQKLAIVANPSLRREMDIQSEQPITDESNQAIYVPLESVPVEDPQTIKEPGDSLKQVLGDIPKTIDTKSVEVLKELILVQRDVIDQQRKVIEQKDEEIFETVREYQSLLSVVTKENEVEDIRQKIIPREDSAKFIQNLQDGERLTGPTNDPKGKSKYVLSPNNSPTATISVVDSLESLVFKFQDNASYLTTDTYDSVKKSLLTRVEEYKARGITLESKVSDFSINGAEGQRVAVERLLIFRSILVELGVSPALIKLKTLKAEERQAEEGVEKVQEEDYGWISVKRNN